MTRRRRKSTEGQTELDLDLVSAQPADPAKRQSRTDVIDTVSDDRSPDLAASLVQHLNGLDGGLWREFFVAHARVRAACTALTNNFARSLLLELLSTVLVESEFTLNLGGGPLTPTADILERSMKICFRFRNRKEDEDLKLYDFERERIETARRTWAREDLAVRLICLKGQKPIVILDPSQGLATFAFPYIELQSKLVRVSDVAVLANWNFLWECRPSGHRARVVSPLADDPPSDLSRHDCADMLFRGVQCQELVAAWKSMATYDGAG